MSNRQSRPGCSHWASISSLTTSGLGSSRSSSMSSLSRLNYDQTQRSRSSSVGGTVERVQQKYKFVEIRERKELPTGEVIPHYFTKRLSELPVFTVVQFLKDFGTYVSDGSENYDLSPWKPPIPDQFKKEREKKAGAPRFDQVPLISFAGMNHDVVFDDNVGEFDSRVPLFEIKTKKNGFTQGLTYKEREQMRKKVAEDKLLHMEWKQDGYDFRKYVPEATANKEVEEDIRRRHAEYLEIADLFKTKEKREKFASKLVDMLSSLLSDPHMRTRFTEDERNAAIAEVLRLLPFEKQLFEENNESKKDVDEARIKKRTEVISVQRPPRDAVPATNQKYVGTTSCDLRDERSEFKKMLVAGNLKKGSILGGRRKFGNIEENEYNVELSDGGIGIADEGREIDEVRNSDVQPIVVVPEAQSEVQSGVVPREIVRSSTPQNNNSLTYFNGRSVEIGIETNQIAHGDVRQWGVRGRGLPIPATQMGFGGAVSNFYIYGNADVRTMREANSQVEATAVFVTAVEEIGAYNTHLPEADQIRLIHPLFAELYERGQIDFRRGLHELEAFSGHSTSRRIAFPMKVPNKQHYVLIMIGLTEKDEIYAHIMDSNDTDVNVISMTVKILIEQLAEHYFGKRRLTIEKGSEYEVELQGTNDCGIHTLLNLRRYFHSSLRFLGPMRRTMRLTERFGHRILTQRREWASRLDAILFEELPALQERFEVENAIDAFNHLPVQSQSVLENGVSTVDQESRENNSAQSTPTLRMSQIRLDERIDGEECLEDVDMTASVTQFGSRALPTDEVHNTPKKYCDNMPIQSTPSSWLTSGRQYKKLLGKQLAEERKKAREISTMPKIPEETNAELLCLESLNRSGVPQSPTKNVKCFEVDHSESVKTPVTSASKKIGASFGEKKKTPTELLKNRKRKHKDQIAEARNQKKRYRFVIDESRSEQRQYLLSYLNAVSSFLAEELSAVHKQLITQLDFNIAGPKDMSCEERKRRQLCRMNIHMYSEKDGKKYAAVNEVYVEAYKDFLQYSDPDNLETNSENLTVEQEISNIVNELVDEVVRNETNEVFSARAVQRFVDDVVGEKESSIDIDITEDVERLEHDGNPIQLDVADDVNDEMEVEMNNRAASQRNSLETEKDERKERARKAVEAAEKDLDGGAYDINEFLMENLGDVINNGLEVDNLYGRIMAGAVTLARKCDEDCPIMDEKEAAVVHSRLIQILKSPSWVSKGFDWILIDYEYEGEKHLVSEWMVRFFPCFQGLRSLKKRLDDLTCLNRIRHECIAFRSKSDEEIRKFITLEDIRTQFRLKFYEHHMPRKSDAHFRQEFVEEKYGQLRANFDASKGQTERLVCDVCQALKAPKHIVKIDVDKCRDKISEDMYNSNKIINICTMCKKAKGVPAASTLNNFQPQKCPEVLSCLNILERMLIERARPVQKQFHLRSINNKKTPMRATTGVLMVVPTEIDATIEHVQHTLPSGSSLIIKVQQPWNDEQKLVSMPRVVEALKWLKANNPLYKDIRIDESFKFTLGENLIFAGNKEATEEDAEKLIARSYTDKGDDGHCLTQATVEHRALHPTHQRNDNQLANVKYIMRRTRRTALPIDQNDLDMMLFPTLHPYGTDGMNQIRTTPVKAAKYARTRLLHSNRVFARNLNYLCFLYGRKQQLHLTSVQGIQARIAPGTKLKDFDLTDEANLKRMTSAYAKIRGFPPYWKAVKSQLRAHVAAFGPPTWYLTLNPNVHGWKDLHQLYSEISGCEVNEKNIDEHMAKDPAIFARYWRNRVDSIWKDVILKPDGPLGKVTHHFHRVEYQHRGAEHIHCVLWTENRPTPDAKPSEVEDFIDQYVTARLPNKETERELFDLVNEQQRHWANHSKTCQRPVRIGGKMTTPKCRFGYPKPVLRRTLVIGDEDRKPCLTGVTTDRPYYLARTPEETHINDYNPALLLAWGANMDLQYIPADATNVVNYIAAYTTKGEKAKRRAQNQEDFAQYANEGMSTKKLLFKIGVTMVHQREVGMLELADDLLGNSNYEFDTAHVNIFNDPKKTRSRVLKPRDRIGNEDVIHEMNWLDNYYPNRPEEFRDCSLYNMQSNFEIVTVKADATTKRNRSPSKDVKRGKSSKKAVDAEANVDDEDEDDDNNDGGGGGGAEENVFKPKDNIGEDRYHINEPLSPFYCHPNVNAGDKFRVMNVRGKCFRKEKQKLPRFYLPKVNWDSVESVEEYHRRLVVVFVPWDDEDDILNEWEVSTYSEVWKEFLSQLEKESQVAYGDLIKLLDGYKMTAKGEEETGKWLDRVRAARKSMVVDEEDAEGKNLELHKRIVNEEGHANDIAQLNKVQREIFDYVTERIALQVATVKANKLIEEENEKLKNDGLPTKPLIPMPEPVQMFVSGTAGTGKSFLINTLADEITMRYSDPDDVYGFHPPVLLDGPTGIAALGVRGTTIHALNGLEVVQSEHYAEEEFQPLSPVQFDKRKFLFSNLWLKITDEISMVSNVTFMKIHRRCTEISGRREMFGGYNMLLFGDLLQLPPVKGRPAFENLSASVLQRVFGTIDTGVNLWRFLKFMELTENMRQGEKGEFTRILERIRTGIQTPEDCERLRARLIACKGEDPTMEEIVDVYIKLLGEDNTVMALFAWVSEVADFNELVMNKINLPNTVTIDAEDSEDYQAKRMFERTKASKLSKPWQRLKLDRIQGMRFGQRNRKKSKPVPVGASYCVTEMQGGLPSQLRIGVGARVMLRRNLNIKDNLVNGATGYVERIGMKDNRVECIFVRFDRDNLVFPIHRVVGRFQHKGEMMTRKMFPLVVAYGATIHKAQGLTLKNVIVRSINIFERGQFYVALSRVTDWKGLYLAGFHPENIKIDVSAVNECNRLRATLDPPLPPLEFNASNKKSDYRPANVSSSDAIESKSSEAKVVGVRKQRMVYETRHTRDHVCDIIPNVRRSVDLKNNGVVEAFTTGLIHSLAMMEHARRQIMDFDENVYCPNLDPLRFSALRRCLSGKESVVIDIVKNQWTDFEYETNLEGLTNEFFRQVIPSQIAQLLCRQYEADLTCQRCKNLTTQQLSRPILWIENGKPRSSLLKHIENELARIRIHQSLCKNKVNGLECNGMLNYRESLGSKSRYLLVGQVNGRDTSYAPLPVDAFAVAESRFLLVGAVRIHDFNIENTMTDKTVETWYKNPSGGWIFADNQGNVEDVSDLQLNDIQLFVFVEKHKERLTEKDKKKEKNREQVIDNFDYMQADFESSDGSVAAKLSEETGDVVMEERIRLDSGNRNEVVNERARFLLLNNINQSCFMNSALNLLYAITPVREWIITHALFGNWLEPIQDVFDGTEMDAVRVRELLPKRFQDLSQQHDAMDAFEEITNHVQDEISVFDDTPPFAGSYQLDECCSNCSRKATIESNNGVVTNIPAPFNTALNGLILKEFPESVKCSECKEGQISRRYTWTSAAEYHVVSLMTDATKRLCTFAYETVLLFGVEWSIEGFIEYISKSPDNRTGHYVAWIKEGEDFYCVDDWCVHEPSVCANTLLLAEFGVTSVLLKRRTVTKPLSPSCEKRSIEKAIMSTETHQPGRKRRKSMSGGEDVFVNDLMEQDRFDVVQTEQQVPNTTDDVVMLTDSSNVLIMDPRSSGSSDEAEKVNPELPGTVLTTTDHSEKVVIIPDTVEEMEITEQQLEEKPKMNKSKKKTSMVKAILKRISPRKKVKEAKGKQGKVQKKGNDSRTDVTTKKMTEYFQIVEKQKNYLPLANDSSDNTSCFLNVALNMLYVCEPLRRNIMERRPSVTQNLAGARLVYEKQVQLLSEIFREGRSAKLLRETMTDFREGQRDSVSAIDYVLMFILKGTDEKIWSSIAWYHSRDEECRSCEFRNVPPVRLAQFMRLKLLKNSTLEDCWKNYGCSINKCKCGAEKLKIRNKVEGTNEYMLLLIDRSPKLPNTKFLKLNRDGVYRLAGQDWRMLAFSEHTTFGRVRGGHYRSHVDSWAASRRRGNWVCIDDSQVSQSTVNPSDVNVSIMVLKKCEM